MRDASVGQGWLRRWSPGTEYRTILELDGDMVKFICERGGSHGRTLTTREEWDQWADGAELIGDPNEPVLALGPMYVHNVNYNNRTLTLHPLLGYPLDFARINPGGIVFVNYHGHVHLEEGE